MQETPQYELLSAYLDDQLSSEERARVEQWLAEDAEAQQTLEQLRAVSASLQGLPAAKLGEDLAERVLRAAEHQILAEPTTLAEEKSADTSVESLKPRTLLQRFLSPRAIAWSGIAVAVAILLTIFPYHPEDSGFQVASSTKKDAVADAVIRGPASPTVTNSPMPASGESAEFYFDSNGSKRPAFSTNGNTASGLSSLSDTDHEFTSREAGSSPTHDGLLKRGLTTTDDRKTKRRSHSDQYTGFGVDTPELESQLPDDEKARSGLVKMESKAVVDHRVPAGGVKNNRRSLLVVKCRLTTEAVNKKAFDKALYDNRIDFVDVRPDQKKVATTLAEGVLGVAPNATPDEKSIELDHRRIMAAGGRKPRRSKPKAEKGVKQAEEVASTDRLDQSRKAKEKTTKRLNSLALIPSTGDAEVEVVLVEGTPTQIASTITALQNRSGVWVSLESQQNGSLWGLQEALTNRSFSTASVQPRTTPPAAEQPREEGGRFGTPKSPEPTGAVAGVPSDEPLAEEKDSSIEPPGMAQRLGRLVVNKSRFYGEQELPESATGKPSSEQPTSAVTKPSKPKLGSGQADEQGTEKVGDVIVETNDREHGDEQAAPEQVRYGGQNADKADWLDVPEFWTRYLYSNQFRRHFDASSPDGGQPRVQVFFVLQSPVQSEPPVSAAADASIGPVEDKAASQAATVPAETSPSPEK